ncbi:MAG: hypothetical protein WED10_00895 [Brumimicrobium sp.]
MIRVLICINLLFFSVENTAQLCWSTSKDNGKGLELEELSDRVFATEKGEIYSGEVYSWHQEGVLCAKGKVHEGLREGEWKTYFIGGALESVGTYSKGKGQGTFEFYHPSGELRGKIKYDEEGLAQGSYSFRFPDGTIEEKGVFLNGENEGLKEEFFKNGVITHIKTNYDQGKLNGARTNYFSNGNVSEEENWKNNQKHGAFTKYYDTGIKKSEKFYVEGKKDGEFKQFSPSGKLLAITTYKSDSKNGADITFNDEGDTSLYVLYEDNIRKFERNYSSGVIVSDKPFDNEGKKHGQVINYNTKYAGQIKSIFTFEHGELKGEALYYFYNSGNLERRKQFGIEDEWTAYEYYDFDEETIETKTQMLGKIKHGVYKKYRKDGSVEIECYYSKGKENGTWKKFKSNGDLFELKTYKNGKKDGRYELYSHSGELKEEGTYKNGRKDGEFFEYYNDGEPKTKSTYVNGKLEGEYIKWDEEGRTLETGQYKNGYRNGVWREKLREYTYIKGVKQID